jgi:hypothetical protein
MATKYEFIHCMHTHTGTLNTLVNEIIAKIKNDWPGQ